MLETRKSTVGLVIPTGYSFNLDGTSIYLTMAAVFIAQATNTPLDLSHQITLLLVLLLTSRARPASRAAASSCWRPRCRRWATCRWPAWR